MDAWNVEQLAVCVLCPLPYHPRVLLHHQDGADRETHCQLPNYLDLIHEGPTVDQQRYFRLGVERIEHVRRVAHPLSADVTISQQASGPTRAHRVDRGGEQQSAEGMGNVVVATR